MKYFNFYYLFVLVTTTTVSTTLPVITTLQPSTCGYGNLYDRVCILEDENKLFSKKIQQLRDENLHLIAVVKNMETKMYDLRDKVKNLEDKDKAFTTALEDLQKQLNELRNK